MCKADTVSKLLLISESKQTIITVKFDGHEGYNTDILLSNSLSKWHTLLGFLALGGSAIAS